MSVASGCVSSWVVGVLGLWCGCVRRVVDAVNESGGGEGGSSFEF